MTEIRLQSDGDPIAAAPWLPSLAALITKAVAMGLLAGTPITGLGADTVQRLVQALQRHGIAAEAGLTLAPLTQPATTGLAVLALDEPARRDLLATLQRLHEALEASAAPQVEWPAMRELFGDEILPELLQVAPSSMRRYAGGSRQTPDDVAARLHWLALTVADLAGAYNAYGIRRWFDRPRAQLGGASPRAYLQASATQPWHPDDAAAAQVRALAASLSGAPAVAA